ncbi:hypothetical protein ACOBV8_19035 (plasmid) [Pseudoalteromonas espejiana]
MGEGLKQGISLPKPLAKKLQPQFAAHVVKPAEDSLFWGPIKSFPESFYLKAKEKITAQYRSLIMTQLVPAYKSI